MWPLNYEVRPGPSSQTTMEKIEELAGVDNMFLTFYDVSYPIIVTPSERPWEKTATEVLREHANLWERLAEA